MKQKLKKWKEICREEHKYVKTFILLSHNLKQLAHPFFIHFFLGHHTNKCVDLCFADFCLGSAPPTINKHVAALIVRILSRTFLLDFFSRQIPSMGERSQSSTARQQRADSTNFCFTSCFNKAGTSPKPGSLFSHLSVRRCRFNSRSVMAPSWVKMHLEKIMGDCG